MYNFKLCALTKNHLKKKIKLLLLHKYKKRLFKIVFHAISRRFLRKPNVTEACESFTQLGQQCENIEMPAYAGLCWIAAARCEGSLGNIPGETSCLVRSARQFIKAEENNEKLGCPGPSGENIQVHTKFFLVMLLF